MTDLVEELPPILDVGDAVRSMLCINRWHAEGRMSDELRDRLLDTYRLIALMLAYQRIEPEVVKH